MGFAIGNGVLPHNLPPVNSFLVPCCGHKTRFFYGFLTFLISCLRFL